MVDDSKGVGCRFTSVGRLGAARRVGNRAGTLANGVADSNILPRATIGRRNVGVDPFLGICSWQAVARLAFATDAVH